MRTIILILIYGLLMSPTQAQFKHEASIKNPFGSVHPDAPKALKDFEPMIGECNCTSEKRNPDGSWYEPEVMLWRFKYIMNGMAVQDETLKEDGSHSGSIRQFIQDSNRWYVHWYSAKTPSAILPTWESRAAHNDKIVLYRDQKAPNGVDGFFRLTFYDMTKSGYKWIGEWVDTSEKIIYPTWKITCIRKDN